MTAIEITCVICWAAPFEVCKNPDGTPAPQTHFPRINQALAVSSSTGEDPELVKQAIDAAVGELI